MTLRRILILGSILCAALLLWPVRSMAVEASWEKEVNQLLKEKRQRYKAYFRRKKEEEKRREQRMRGVNELKAKQKKMAVEHEKAREKFIYKKKFEKKEVWQKPRAFARYLRQERNRQRRHAKSRSEYNNKLKYINKRLNKSDQVLTDAQEYGYEPVETPWNRGIEKKNTNR